MLEMFRASLGELKNTRKIVLLGVLIAIGVAVELVNPLNISNSIKIRFTFVVLAVIGYISGPACCMFAAVICDILSAVIKPSGAYFVGFTLSAAVGGIIYGAILYRMNRNIVKNTIADTVIKCTLSKVLVSLIVSVFLNSVMIKYVSGLDEIGFRTLLTARVAKNAVMLLIEIPIMTIIITELRKNKKINKILN